MKFNKDTKKKKEVYENMIILLFAFCEINSIHYDVIENAFNVYILNRKLKQALSDLEYYSDSNLKEDDFFGNFLKLSRNKNNTIYSRESSMKEVFKESKTLIDVLVASKVSTTKIRDFIQEINFTLDFEEHEVAFISASCVDDFNKINIIDADEEEVA